MNEEQLRYIPEDDCIPCGHCAEARKNNNIRSILSCHKCKGTGIVRKPESYICNKCGGSLLIDTGEAKEYHYPDGLIDAKVSGGYSSPHLSDCTEYIFSLCEKCLRELFATFKIAPAIFDYMGAGAADSYEEDVDWYNFKIWRDAGGQKEKLSTGICNYREHCTNKAIWRHFMSSHLSDEAVCNEHKFGYANSYFAPARLLKDIPSNKEEWTRIDHTKVVEVWLSVASNPKGGVTYLRYMPSTLRDLLGIEEEKKTSGLWLPHGEDKPDWLVDMPKSEFESGTMYYAPEPDVRKLVSSEKPVYDETRDRKYD